MKDSPEGTRDERKERCEREEDGKFGREGKRRRKEGKKERNSKWNNLKKEICEMKKLNLLEDVKEVNKKGREELRNYGKNWKTIK